MEKLEDIANIDVTFDPQQGKIICKLSDDFTKLIDPYELRIKCLCAACVDEVDGRQILKPNQVPQDVFPTKIIKKGNYAIAMIWSDGHKSSIYPYDRLKSNHIKGQIIQ